MTRLLMGENQDTVMGSGSHDYLWHRWDPTPVQIVKLQPLDPSGVCRCWPTAPRWVGRGLAPDRSAFAREAHGQIWFEQRIPWPERKVSKPLNQNVSPVNGLNVKHRSGDVSPDGSVSRCVLSPPFSPQVNCNGFTIEDEELSHLGSAVFPE